MLAHPTSAHEALCAAARKTDGDTAGTRELIEVLLLHRSVDAGDVSSHHGRRSIQHMHTASPGPALTGLPVRAPREPAPGQAAFAGSDQACLWVYSRDKIGVTHHHICVCACAKDRK